MKKLSIIIRQAAISDLEEIWLYTVETWSVEQADRYHDSLFKEIEFFSRKPNSGKSISELRTGYFASKVKSHFIFYKFSSAELEIVRILHESMDIPSRL